MTSASDASLAAALFAVDPVGCGGISLRARWGPLRDGWLANLQTMLAADIPVRRLPPNVSDDRLLGGLDLAATLQAKRPIVERGLLAEADGGIVVVSMAERLAPSTVAHITAALDLRCVVVERDGIAARQPAAVGLVLLDEGIAEDEGVANALRDRLAFHVELVDAVSSPGRRSESSEVRHDREAMVRARHCLADVVCGEAVVEALCEAAMALGIASVRAPLLALRVARANAALEGRRLVDDTDAVIAGRLVLVPRATRVPADEPLPQEEDDRPEESDSPRSDEDEQPGEDVPNVDQALADMIVAAARAAMPAQILDQLQASEAAAARLSAQGKAGSVTKGTRRGRPAGTRPGDPRGRSRLNVIETLRAAAPWQSLRRIARERAGAPYGRKEGVEIRREDFRIARFKQQAATTTIFVVDASGSSAANRLAEAKGAVELLLADCYVRRDEVALIAFRGRSAEVVLPPTRSLVRAKRSLAGLPGGGGTPLAAAIDMAGQMANAIARKGQSPVVVLLTDGRANVSRDGKPGAMQAGQEATAASRSLRLLGMRTLIVDTSPRPQVQAEQLARDMGARYLPLPYANSRELSDAIQASVAV